MHSYERVPNTEARKMDKEGGGYIVDPKKPNEGDVLMLRFRDHCERLLTLHDRMSFFRTALLGEANRIEKDSLDSDVASSKTPPTPWVSKAMDMMDHIENITSQCNQEMSELERF